jgi:hypothetical protein
MSSSLDGSAVDLRDDDTVDDAAVPPVVTLASAHSAATQIGIRRRPVKPAVAKAAVVRSYAVMTLKQTWKQISFNKGTCCVGFW